MELEIVMVDETDKKAGISRPIIVLVSLGLAANDHESHYDIRGNGNPYFEKEGSKSQYFVKLFNFAYFFYSCITL